MNDRQVQLQLSTSQKYLPAHSTATIYLMLKIIQPKITLDTNRLPLNISFVLDRSGSMNGAKLGYTKKAVQFALRNLDSIDQVSLVTFDDQVELPIPSTTAENKDQLAQLVETIYDRGSTNLSGGLLEGVNQVKSAYRPELVNRVILLTDGLANEGLTDPARLKEIVTGIYARGIGLSTLGVGSDFDEDLLVALAEAAGGNFYFIETPDAIPPIFAEELSGLLSVTGQNPSLKITPAPRVSVSAVLGYEPVFVDGALIKLPDIYNGDSKTVLVELQVTTGAPAMMSLAAVHFSYFDVTADLAKIDYNLQVSLEATTDAEAVSRGFDLKVTKEVELFKMAQAREDAIREADLGNFASAKDILYQKKASLDQIYLESGDEDLLPYLSKIEQEINEMEAPTYSPLARKKMKNESYQQRRKN